VHKPLHLSDIIALRRRLDRQVEYGARTKDVFPL
jgi:hypothetical protein